MTRRTLDILFSFEGLAIAGLLLVLGLVLISNANFAKDYVGDQQAECYANEFIGLHVKSTAGANGMTYSELGTPQSKLRADIAAARETLAMVEAAQTVMDKQLVEV